MKRNIDKQRGEGGGVMYGGTKAVSTRKITDLRRNMETKKGGGGGEGELLWFPAKTTLAYEGT